MKASLAYQGEIMVDFNYAIQQPPAVSIPVVKQEIIQKPDPKSNQYVQINSLTSLPLGYNGINPNDNKGVSVQLPQNFNLDAYKALGQNAALDVKSRVGKKGEVLGWVQALQTDQLKNLDSIYNLADEAKKGDYTNLVVLGMGGSRYPNETLVNLLGKESKIKYFSAIDKQSFDNFSKNLDLDKTKFLVVSKSGGTLETTTAYQNFRKLMQDHLKKEDVSDRFIAMTNPDAAKSKLRQQVDKGEIKLSGKVHDDISGGYSMFDDATLFTLAYAGVSKADTQKMLETSLSAQKEFLNPDINKNEALKLASFNVDAKSKGNTKQFVDYFGDYFAGSAAWEKQLKNEGLKSSISTDTNIGPEFLHYITESDLSDKNKDSFYTFVYVKPQEKATSALINGAVTAYSERHPVSKIELKDLSPKTIARFVELKHFETLYTGNMLRQQSGELDATKTLPEVTQTNVNKYKQEVKKNFDY